MSVYKAVLLLSFTASQPYIFYAKPILPYERSPLLLIHGGFCVIIVAVIKIKVKSARHCIISSVSARRGNK